MHIKLLIIVNALICHAALNMTLKVLYAHMVVTCDMILTRLSEAGLGWRLIDKGLLTVALVLGHALVAGLIPILLFVFGERFGPQRV